MRKLLLMISILFSFSLSAETLVLNENTISIRGGIDYRSMGEAINELLELSNKLPVNESITIVIDSPGGSVYAGMQFIQVMQSVPQSIRAVCLFCASMGSSIFEHADVRYVTPHSVLMFHRAKGTFKGQFSDGEIEQRLKLWSSIIESLEKTTAEKMGITIEEYKTKIKDELWIYGRDNVNQGTADSVMNITCTKELIEDTKDYYVRTMIGSAKYTFSKCPLVTLPVKGE